MLIRNIVFYISLVCIVVNAERAVITLMQPRHQFNSGGTDRLCTVEDLSDSASPTMDNCPGGSTCSPTQSSGAFGRCTVNTVAVHQGAGAFDFEADTVLSLESQMDSSGDKIDCAIPDAAANASSTTLDLVNYRCIETAATLEDVSDVTLYTTCEVKFLQGIGSKMTLGKVGSIPHDSGGVSTVQTDAQPVFKRLTNKVTCHFTPENNKFLGYTHADVRFIKDPLKLSQGEKEYTIVKIPLIYKPGSKALAGVVDSTSYAADPTPTLLHPDIGYASGDGFDYSSSTSSGGSVSLPYDFIVLDRRYLIAEQTGIETLATAIGSHMLIKQGIEIHHDYVRFYDPTKNLFIQEGIDAIPIDFASYKSGNCSAKGQGAGEAMSSTGCTNFFERFYSQYRLQGTYQFTYGDMPHFKKGYVGCQLCQNALSIKGFKNTLFELDVTVPIDVTQLQSGCTQNCFALPNVFATEVTTGIGHESSAALRLPNCDSDGQNCGSLSLGYDPQHADGHALSEFMTPILDGDTTYDDLDSNFDFLSSDRMVVTSGDKNITAESGLLINPDCASKGSGQIHAMGSDMLASAKKLFYDDCKIKVLNKEFARASYVALFKSKADKDACTTLACANAVYSKIIEVDKRRIIVGNTELSLLRRKLASVTKAGQAITMLISKYTETDGVALSYKIVGTDTMVGYGSDSTECTGVDAPAGIGCTEAIRATERDFVTDPVNGKTKAHTIRSSIACTGYMDIQFQDQHATFGIYDLRVPCSRSTAATSDSISLSYDFTLGYDLVTNKVTADASYLKDMSSNPDNDYSDSDGISQKISVSAAYGQCVDSGSGADTIDLNNLAGVTRASVGCDASTEALGKLVDSGAPTNKFTSTQLDLDNWKDCSYSSSDDFGDESVYTVVTSIAMLYDREVNYTSSSGTIVRSNQFCSDRKFTTTIARDSSASVTVSSLLSPQLERAVRVTGLNWENCASGGYQLVVELKSNEKYVNQDDSYWANSPLNDAMLSINPDRFDTDGLTVDKGTMSITTPTHEFKLKSSCIPITQADCDAITDPHTDPADATGSAYAQLSSTKTDIVVRGVFNSIDIDSDVQIATSYLNCPLDQSNIATGFVRSAAEFDCSEPLETVASTTIQNRNDCKKSYTTATGTATVDLYVESSSTGLVTAAGKTRAINDGWVLRTVDISIERYETLFGGAEGALVSTDKFCKCGSSNVPFVQATAAPCLTHADTGSGLADRVYGLSPFSTIECGNSTAGFVSYNHLKFNFLPFTASMNDLFKVVFTVVSENDNLDARRHLRHSLTLRAVGGEYTVSSGGFTVVAPSITDGSNSEAPAPDAPETSETPLDDASSPPSSESESDGLEWYWIVLIAVGGAGVIGALVWYFVFRETLSSSSISEEETANLIPVPGVRRKQRFSNLKY